MNHQPANGRGDGRACAEERVTARDTAREAIEEAALPVCDAISRAMYGGCEMEYLTPENQRLVQRAAGAAGEALAPYIDRLVEQARTDERVQTVRELRGRPANVNVSVPERLGIASTGEGAALARQVARMRRAQGVSLTGEGDRG